MDEMMSKPRNDITTALHELNMLNQNTSRSMDENQLQNRNLRLCCNSIKRQRTRNRSLDNPRLMYPSDVDCDTHSTYISKLNVRKNPPSSRIKPYHLPMRTRTRSENSDPSTSTPSDTSYYLKSDIVATRKFLSIYEKNCFRNNIPHTLKELGALKKSKSLEDIRVVNREKSQSSQELEFVSNCIQKLKVQE